MEFIKVSGTDKLVESVVSALRAALAKNLRVLWLVPGGSNLAVVVEVMKQIPVKDTHRLTLMLTDERYGQIGHEDSNYYQLKQLGFVEHESTFVQTLSNSPLVETVDYMSKVAEKMFTEAGAVVGFFGMGADGHIAGIKPGSPATTDMNWVCGYQGEDFTRITLTPQALSHVTHAIVGAFGAEKQPALERLRDEMLSVAEQPAQLLKHLPKAQIYNDQIGEDR